ncbi:myozenin-2-like [Stigmatopora argus]
MSLFSTMTSGERKCQALAICREIQGLEDVEMDLGKKVSVPRDIMLEELSLESNRGSRLFKMRQQRSQKYTFESTLNDRNSHLNKTADSPSDNPKSPEDGSSAEKEAGEHRADAATVPDPYSIAPGYGGPLKDVPPEKFNSTAVPKSYRSPWDRSLSRDDALMSRVSEPEPPADLPGYKSFNRVAIPFGGFSAAPVKHPKPDLVLPDYPELIEAASARRPSFNRAALGWLSAGAPAPLCAMSPEATAAPESDDL